MKNSNFFRQPAEWAPHSAVWLAWPSHEDLWEESLPLVQKEFTELCKAISDVDSKTGKARGERLEILLNREEDRKTAEKALSGLDVRFHLIPFGDIWVRDTGPIFVHNSEGKVVPASFLFNGWGEKYLLPFDPEVSLKLSLAAGLGANRFDWILEGGSIDVDGEGTCLTTEQCLLNPNRNPRMNRKDVETKLAESLGITHTIWLKNGLKNDHTDGHIDTLARFVSPGRVICMRTETREDPNFEALEEIYEVLCASTDAAGRRLQVTSIPSPGIIFDEEGDYMPASYANFYIANSTVVVPTYGTPFDAKAVAAIAACFPNRKTVGLSALKILEGGGAFHCISQQQPTAISPAQGASHV